jgi:hypothetical protein
MAKAYSAGPCSKVFSMLQDQKEADAAEGGGKVKATKSSAGPGRICSRHPSKFANPRFLIQMPPACYPEHVSAGPKSEGIKNKSALKL